MVGGIAALTPRLSHPGVSIAGVEKVESPNYLFVTLRHRTGCAGRHGSTSNSSTGAKVALRHPWGVWMRAKPDRRCDAASMLPMPSIS